MVRRRVDGLPLEPILGWVDFAGLRLAIEPGVFVPRQRSVLLVGEALALLSSTDSTSVVVEMCCGCGAVGAALCNAVSNLELYAADIDPVAAACARRNLPDAHVVVGDLYDPLPETLRGNVNLIVANAPYVPTDAIELMPPEARIHEPRVALDGGADGVDVHRRLAAAAPEWLAPGGQLLVETGRAQAPKTADAFNRNGLTTHVVTSEELGATVVIGAWETAL
jgi:release factor glutamine methyltransferase